MSKTLTQIKREFWECRASFILTPGYVALILAVLLLMGAVPIQNIEMDLELELGESSEERALRIDSDFADKMRSAGSEAVTVDHLIHGLAAVHSVFAIILLLVLTFYFVDCLYSDRRDRSILFWKSMPVSETRGLLAKCAAGLLGAPVFYGLAALATALFSLIVLSLYAKLFWDLPVPAFTTIASAFITTTLGIIPAWALLALWLLPAMAWLIFVSAFARKAPIMIALGVPLTVIVIEAWLFNSAVLVTVLKHMLKSAFSSYQAVLHNPLRLFEQGGLALTSAAFWLGLLATLSFLSGAVWLRIYRWEL